MQQYIIVGNSSSYRTSKEIIGILFSILFICLLLTVIFMLHIWVTGQREKTAMKDIKDADEESGHSATIQLDCEDGIYDSHV